MFKSIFKLFSKSDEQKQKDALWEAFTSARETTSAERAEVKSTFRPNKLENDIAQLFRSYIFIKDGYAIYELKKYLQAIDNLQSKIRHLNDEPVFADCVTEAAITVETTGNITLAPEIVQSVQENDIDTFNGFVNTALLEVTKRIEEKNYELIKGYKRKDHIRGRYETIVDSAKTISGLLLHSENKSSIHYELMRIADRSSNRGQLHIKA
jgi:hypothetical protein